MPNQKSLKITYVAPYFPKECGIASYTKELVTAYNNLVSSSDSIEVTAINDMSEKYVYPNEVKTTLQFDKLSSYKKIAQMINNSDCNLVHIQHEFGLYGGEDGSFILNLTDYLKKPYVLTFHTVLSNPSDNKMKIIQSSAKKARAIIVMANEAIKRLNEIYGLEVGNIHKISHGVPDISVDGNEKLKAKFGYKGQKIISTFGLINKNKGIEYVIEALPEIIQKFPHTIYLIIGRTHPLVVKKEGEKYRTSLESMVDRYKIGDHVHFINKFLSQDELIDYLRATDIYITPYLEPEQISSGALAYALGAGKVCISTPYAYAREVLALGRGFIVPFCNSSAIEKITEKIFLETMLQKKVASRSYTYGREMIWPSIAAEHFNLFHKLLDN